MWRYGSKKIHFSRTKFAEKRAVKFKAWKDEKHEEEVRETFYGESIYYVFYKMCAISQAP